jgi:hypothetical protein
MSWLGPSVVVQRFLPVKNEANLKRHGSDADALGSRQSFQTTPLPSLGHTFAITLCATRDKSSQSGYLAQLDNRQEVMSVDVRHDELVAAGSAACLQSPRFGRKLHRAPH